MQKVYEITSATDVLVARKRLIVRDVYEIISARRFRPTDVLVAWKRLIVRRVYENIGASTKFG